MRRDSLIGGERTEKTAETQRSAEYAEIFEGTAEMRRGVEYAEIFEGIPQRGREAQGYLSSCENQ